MSRKSSKANLWNHSQYAKLPPAILLAGLVVCVLAWFYQYSASVDEADHPNTVDSPVRINELMSANKSALTDDRGSFSDWIELLNPSNQPIDITGWKLSDGSSIFTFPRHILQPGETALVFASGSVHAIEGEAYHAPFRLSASGETVTLTNELEQTVDAVELPPLDPNTAYARNAQGQWIHTAAFTPALDNAAQYVPASESPAVSGLIISEVMAKNVSISADEDGEFSDYIELYNGSGRTISLRGFMLSDDDSERNKWIFPNVSIAHGEYLIVYASGKDRAEPRLHTSFSLSADGESVVLCDSEGRLLDKMSYTAAEADRPFSRIESGEWVASLPATPALSNDHDSAARLASALYAVNTEQIFINELMYSTRVVDKQTRGSYDWIELYNASTRSVNLSGWGLSDSPARPRKWQFPEGTTLGAGQYLVVYLSGQDGLINMQYHAPFSLSMSESEAVTLCRPDGTIVDRTPINRQYAELSYGKISAKGEFAFFETPTPGQSNSPNFYYGRSEEVRFSQEGGMQHAPFTLTLSAGEGETIYYTTDCTEPTTASQRYTGPISVSSNTVIRAIAVKSGYKSSICATRTYLFGVNHTLPVVSLVADPDGMFGAKNGLYTNYEEEGWTRDASIEFYTTDGTRLFAQGAEISLHGNDARLCDQKTFNVIARSKYGDNRFRAAIFPNRDYTEYQSFLLRPSSEDSAYTRMRCSILSSLLETGSNLMYQDTVVAVLYINGEYWGHYNLRERTNTAAICQWEGWTDPDRIDLVKGNAVVMQGSNQTFVELLEWLKTHSLAEEEHLAYVRTIVDIENYLDYVMFQMFVSNSDLLNVKRYRSTEGDGRWRWIIFDLDWAFHNDTNSWADWIGYDNRKPRDGTDTTLFRALMKNPGIRDYFLTRLGERLAGEWSADVIVAKIAERTEMLRPEMSATYAKWEGSVKRWEEKVALMRAYAQSRPAKLIGYIDLCEGLTDAQVEKYFGEALRVNPLPQ